MKTIRHPENWSSPRPYSPGVLDRGWLYLSGHVPVDGQGQTPAGGVREQTLQTLANIDRTLAAAELTRKDLLSTSVFLTDMTDMGDLDLAYRDFFGDGPYPTRTTVQIVSLGRAEFRVEISAVARAGASSA